MPLAVGIFAPKNSSPEFLIVLSGPKRSVYRSRATTVNDHVATPGSRLAVALEAR
jgi:hypothetical protein